MTARSELFIAGAWREGAGAPFASRDPASGAAVWEGLAAAPQDVAAAAAAAREAFPDWSRRPMAERRDIALAYKAALQARSADLAQLISREMGKPLWESEGETAAMIGKIDISLSAYEERTGERESETAFGRAALRHRPHGVMAVFGPYNFPGHLPNGHIAPALIAGNTVVFKPSELTPAVGAAMVEAWEAAGAPPGVVNLVQGARDTGAALLEADVDGVLFTGSVETGLMIHRRFAGRPDVILALEMGGNNPLIVWDVADAEAAAVIALQSAFITSGQRCSCARRLIAPEGPAGDGVIEALVALVERARMGAWNAEPEPFMGPLVAPEAAERVVKADAVLRARGARVLRSSPPPPLGSAFVGPTILDVTGVGEVPDKEVFGPLLQVWRAPSFEAALERANATAFGLAAGLVCDDAALWERFRLAIRAGVVNWNRPTTGAASTLPFGGPGLSGNHRPSAAYAADYCAYPMASQEADAPERLKTRGVSDG
ncbi:MAG: succinylglutamate-semialdehyde dehydrogenase [Caulobacterales bacterium]|nr:succinylglutamate-semialdehyde dehydrogenase [Caulobacterales bacterium]